MSEVLSSTMLAPGSSMEHEDLSDIARSNLERLEAAGEVGLHFAELYRTALEVEPLLSEVVIHPAGKKEIPFLAHTGGAARHQGHGDKVHPEVIVNTSDGWLHFAKLKESRPISTQVSANKAGVEPWKFGSKTLATFIFLHELGHTVDYMTRVPDLEVCQEKRRAEVATLPISGYDPAQLALFLDSVEGHAYMLQNRDALRAHGYKNAADLMYAQEKAYHDLDSEDFPDQFAASVMQKMREPTAANL